MNQPTLPPIPETELEEHFDRSSGPGGQNVNKVSTKVTLRHIPTGITVTIQDTRSQARNRALARQRLAEALRARKDQAKKQAIQKKELERRRKAPPPPPPKPPNPPHKKHPQPPQTPPP